MIEMGIIKAQDRPKDQLGNEKELLYNQGTLNLQWGISKAGICKVFLAVII